MLATPTVRNRRGAGFPNTLATPSSPGQATQRVFNPRVSGPAHEPKPNAGVGRDPDRPTNRPPVWRQARASIL